MDLSKFFIGTVIGGISYFFLGWLVFGILLRGLTALPEDVAAVVEIPEEDFRISLMIISCFITAALHTLILMRWAKVSTFLGGLKVSAIIGGLITLSVGLSMASMFKMNTVDQVIINAIGDIVCSGLMGGMIGWYLGKSR